MPIYRFPGTAQELRGVDQTFIERLSARLCQFELDRFKQPINQTYTGQITEEEITQLKRIIENNKYTLELMRREDVHEVAYNDSSGQTETVMRFKEHQIQKNTLESKTV